MLWSFDNGFLLPVRFPSNSLADTRPWSSVVGIKWSWNSLLRYGKLDSHKWLNYFIKGVLGFCLPTQNDILKIIREQTLRITAKRSHFWSSMVSMFIGGCGKLLQLNSAEGGGQLDFITSIYFLIWCQENFANLQNNKIQVVFKWKKILQIN